MALERLDHSEISETRLIEFAKTVELTATRFLEGQHRSPRPGGGVEYHSSVPYSEGEDAKHIDWKRYARADRFFVNRYEREEKTSWQLAIDRSGSMKYGQKSEYAEEFIGILGFLARVWSDPCSIFPEGRLPFEEGAKALAEHRLGFTSPQDLLNAGRRSKEDRLVIVSDFFWESAELKSVLNWAEGEYPHTYLVQVLDSRELNFDFQDPMIEFHDLESADKLVLSAASVRKNYLELLKKLWAEMDQLKAESAERFLFVSEREKMGTQLQMFFDRILGTQS